VPSKDGWLYVWRSNGTGYLAPDGKFASFPSVCISAPAVADVDGDTYPEIFIGNGAGAVYAWNHDGTPFRLPSGQFKYIGGFLWSAPVIGDVDDDGAMEIVAASQNDSVYVMRTNAAYEAGWPQGTGGYGIISSTALGDLDRDGKLEIVVGSNNKKIYAWHFDGTAVPGYPIAVRDSVLGSPAIGDVSGDGYPDVVVGSADHFVYAFDRFGQRLPGWPQRTYDKIWHSAPAITDLDLDGDVEVVQAAYDGFLYVWDLSVPYDESTMDWPTYQHDRYRSGFAHWTDPDPSTSVAGTGATLTVPASTRLGEVVPNPANPRATVHFDLAVAGVARLSVYDVTGRLVARLLDERLPAGRHQTTWDGRGTGDRPAATGVYFVRLETDAARFTRKMLLVR